MMVVVMAAIIVIVIMIIMINDGDDNDDDDDDVDDSDIILMLIQAITGVKHIPETINVQKTGICFSIGGKGRLRGLAVACWTTDHYHPCSNPGVAISEGCFVFHFVSLPWEVARPI